MTDDATFYTGTDAKRARITNTASSMLVVLGEKTQGDIMDGALVLDEMLRLLRPIVENKLKQNEEEAAAIRTWLAAPVVLTRYADGVAEPVKVP